MKIGFKGFCVLRTPLFPYNKIADIKDPVFKEALYVSSPSIYDALQNGRDVEVSLEKYRRRASFRCTPYGLFAGLSRLEVNEEPVILEEQSEYKRQSRIDQLFYNEILQNLDSALFDKILFKPNNTIYNRGNDIGYIEYDIVNKIRNYRLVCIESIPEVETILEKSKNGLKFKDLVTMLSDQDIDTEDALEFIKELVSSKLLIGEFELSHTSQNVLDPLLKKLSSIENEDDRIRHYFDELVKLNEKFTKLNKLPLGNGLSTYLEINDISKKINLSLPEGMLCNSELCKPILKGGISQEIIDECISSLTFLTHITNRKHHNLENFKEKFVSRYGDQFIPLMEVIDDEIGLGYPISRGRNIKNTSFLKGVQLPKYSIPGEETLDNWSKQLMSLIGEVKKDSEELDLSNFTIENKNGLTNPIELDFSVAINIHEPVNDQCIIRLNSTYGPSSLNHILRFRDSIISDKDVEAVINQENKKYEDIILAEIVHIPHPRVANILKKGNTYSYEIPIVSKPNTSNENTIPLSDLHVGIERERIILFSKKNNKEVIPRQSSSHNYGFNSIPVYRFLCDLKDQRFDSPLAWDWGALEGFEYLPRVRYNNTILARRRWYFNFKSHQAIDIKSYLQERLDRYRVPRKVLIINDDQELPIDIKDDFQLMIDEAKRYKEIRIEENLFDVFGTFVKDKQGNPFTNEVVLPFGIDDAKIKGIISSPRMKSDVQPSFQPGSEWHYFKLYCSESSADSILAELIKPWVDQLVTEGRISKFFYIRYADPDHHIRLRFLTNEKGLVQEIFERLSKSFHDRAISKIQMDVYNRELNRYGRKNIERCESIFHYDSMAVLHGIKHGSEKEKWKLAIKGSDEYLNNFRFSIEDKVKLMRMLSNGYADEFRIDKKTKSSLSEKFRNHRKDINAIIDGNEGFDSIFARSSYIQELIDLMDYSESNKFDLTASLIHMFLNRLFSSHQRLHELVIYDLLFKHYNSSLAQINNASEKK